MFEVKHSQFINSAEASVFRCWTIYENASHHTIIALVVNLNTSKLCWAKAPLFNVRHYKRRVQTQNALRRSCFSRKLQFSVFNAIIHSFARHLQKKMHTELYKQCMLMRIAIQTIVMNGYTILTRTKFEKCVAILIIPTLIIFELLTIIITFSKSTAKY